MGFYISGMEMPQEIEPGLVVEFAEGVDGKRYARLHHCQYGGLTDWLEAVPVPPHGRLGDLDELLKHIREEGRNQAEFYANRHHPVVLAYGDCYGKVKDAPTIIPASEERV